MDILLKYVRFIEPKLLRIALKLTIKTFLKNIKKKMKF